MSEYFKLAMASRNRKQRFPHPDRRRSSNILQPNGSLSEHEYDSDENYFSLSKRSRDYSLRQPIRLIKSNDKPNKDTSQTSRLDKRARDEHNEQERSRRRELAVIYELIRCSFSQEDLRHLGPGNAPKSIEKLSYPQVLQIAYHVVREENHNLQLFERTLSEIKRIEKELIRIGLPVPARPLYPSITETYRKVVNIVDALLKHDKAARAINGNYEITPAQRAALGDYQLAFLKPKHKHENISLNSNYSLYNAPGMVISRSNRVYNAPIRQSLVSLPNAPIPTTNLPISQHVNHNITDSVKPSLPNIGIILKNESDDANPLLSASDEDVISSRTMQHSSSAASMEYIDEMDLPPIGDSLSVDENLCFFDHPLIHQNSYTPDVTSIFPEIPL